MTMASGVVRFAMPLAVGRQEGVPTVLRSIALTSKLGWPGSDRDAASRRLAGGAPPTLATAGRSRWATGCCNAKKLVFEEYSAFER
jgi:hypothetical protein